MAQNKLTEVVEGIDISELPRLTPKQEKFFINLMSGMKVLDAYRDAYDAQNSGDNTVYVNAARIRSNPNFMAWVNAAKMAGLQRGVYSLEQHLADLHELAVKAEKAGNYGAAVNAKVNAGKAAGLYIERIEDVNDTRALELDEKLRLFLETSIRKESVKEELH